jgi:hypothetical protein
MASIEVLNLQTDIKSTQDNLNQAIVKQSTSLFQFISGTITAQGFSRSVKAFTSGEKNLVI